MTANRPGRASGSRRGETGSSAGGPAVLVVVCVALFFGVLNGSAVAVVLPEIGADLGIADADLPWVLSGFLLTYGVAIPFYGRLAGRFGARPLFLIGVTVFAVGSVLSAVASGFMSLIVARTIQAAGGAAVPGLGMTLASRAFPEERRGFVLGIVSATMGLGAAAGPLGAGLITEIASWRYLFALSAISAVSVPLGVRYLDRSEERDDAPLDLAGGALFGLGVASLLFFVSRGSQTGWADISVVVTGLVVCVAFAVFVAHQRHGDAPFIPASLLANRTYLTLTLLGFAATFANLAAQIGFPFLFTELHGLSTLAIGVALVPAALTTAVVGIVAGGIVDRVGAVGPIRTGGLAMALAAIAISSLAGSSAWSIAVVATVFAAGFALINTPLAAVVSLSVESDDLAAALSLNTMMFFVGGSFGATLFSSIVLETGADSDAWNPLHSDAGPGFSNAFLALVIPIAIALLLSRTLRGHRSAIAADSASVVDRAWAHQCEVPWSPDVDHDRTLTTTGVNDD